MSESERPLWASVIHPALIPPQDPESPLHLWRDTVRLGVLIRRTDLSPRIAAEARRGCDLHTILVPAPGDDSAIVPMRWRAELVGVVQRRGGLGTRDVLFHYPRAPWDRATRRPVTLSLSAKARRAVTPLEAYAIRDSAGEALPFRRIGILEIRLIPGRDDVVASHVPASAVHDGSFWLVTAFL